MPLCTLDFFEILDVVWPSLLQFAKLPILLGIKYLSMWKDR